MEQSSGAWAATYAAFADAAGWYLDVVGRVGDRWEEPGLGVWTVLDLVGHTSRSLLTVETYLPRTADSAEIGSAFDYYVAAFGAVGADQEAVAQRGRDAGAALGSDPVAAVAQIAARVLPLVERCTGDELLTTIGGGMRLIDYLRTRTFELVVHTSDLCVALGLPPQPPSSAARDALEIVSELALASGSAGRLLLAATGRSGSGFSVLAD